MSKIYDIAFRMGVLFSILLFTISNVTSFVVKQNEFENREINFAHDGYGWGFPFEMYRNYLGYPQNDIGFTPEGLVLNTFVVTACAFIFGFLFKFVWSKISRRAAELK